MKHHLTSAAHLLLPLALTGIAHAQLKTGSNTETITSTANFEVESTSGSKTVVDKTTGNLGIGTTSPGSTLTVNGSIAGGYSKITATTYTLTAADNLIIWSGNAAGTITLPAAVDGAGNFKGRTYTLRNSSATGYGLTLASSGSEMISGSASLSIGSGASLTVTSTGLTSGDTWEIIHQSSAGGTLTGTFTEGVDLSGMPSVSHSIPLGTGPGQWTPGVLGSTTADPDETAANADITPTTMNTLMSSLPSGGVIQISFPSTVMSSNTTNHGSNYLNLALPAASGFLGKSYYITFAVNPTSGLGFQKSIINSGYVYASMNFVKSSAADRLYTGLANTPTDRSVTKTASTYFFDNQSGGNDIIGVTYYLRTMPIYKLTGVADGWFVQKVGDTYVYN